MIQTPIQITARGFLLAAWWKDLIRKKANKLDEFHDKITSRRLVVEAPPKHHRRGRLYRVRLDIEVPGGFIVVDREPAATLDEALERTFDAAGRRLQDFARRKRGSVKRRQAACEGRVLYTLPETGYGFLLTEDGREIYFHCNSVLGGLFHRLTPGSRVRFIEEAGDKGPQASTVKLLTLAPRHERRRKLTRRLPHPSI